MIRIFERARRAPRSLECSFLVACGVLAYPAAAHAYCRATTCDQPACTRDQHGCLIDGAPVSWPLGTIAIDVDSKGSPLRRISGAELETAVSAAVETWAHATCPHGGHPALHTTVTSLAGGTPGFVDAGPNENLMIMIDGTWPYEANALGKTLLAFGLDSGELFDADVALNSGAYPYSTTGQAGDVDLLAVLTHEMGHVLGLDHSDVPGATMQPETQGFATLDLRSLEPDDMAGICAIYPPETKAPATSGGEPSSGGCAVHPGRAPSSITRALPLLFAISRRRRARMNRCGKLRARQAFCTGTGSESRSPPRAAGVVLFRRRSP